MKTTKIPGSPVRNSILQILNILIFAFLIIIVSSFTSKKESVKQVIDKVVTNLYETKTPDELSKLDYNKVISLFSKSDLQVLSTKHWVFDVNVPVVVSVMRSIEQKRVPFWLEKNGFTKTSLTVKNEQTTYEIWQKSFDKGNVGLGINGFEDFLLHYFVSVRPQKKGDNLVLSNFIPANQFVGILEDGAFTYHDWDELVLKDVPVSMKGEKLLTTTRGRSSESHLINAFRTTEHPSSATPDQIMQTWSSDPSTTIDIQWRTNTTVQNLYLIYREKGKTDETKIVPYIIKMEDRMLMNDRYVNHYTAGLKDLKPGVSYEYKITSQPDFSEGQVFTTAQKNNSWSFMWFGDTHYSPKFGQILMKGYEKHPDISFFSIVGDLVSDGLHRDQWDNLLDYSKSVIQRIPLMAIPGNHDNRLGLGAQIFQDEFSYPSNGPEGLVKEQTYSFTYKNTLFLMIDATLPIEAQTSWIEKELRQSDATWKIAMFHFPPYNWEEPYFNIQKAWVPLFDKYHVDLVFNGHIHYYMRSKPMKNGRVTTSYSSGTAYIISVGIPNGHHEMTDEPYAAVRDSEGHLYQYIKINENHLYFEAVNFDGKTIDSFEINK